MFEETVKRSVHPLLQDKRPEGSGRKQLRIKPCPEAGTGVHRWMFGVACWAAENDIPYEQAKILIEEGLTREPNPANEVKSALDRAYGLELPAVSLGMSPAARRKAALEQRRKTPQEWPERNERLIFKIARTGPGLIGLWKSSPVAITAGPGRTEELIDILFPGNPLLCAGGTMYWFCTHPRETWRGTLKDKSFMVPSPMTQTRGRTKAGKRESWHTLDNTGPRRFLVTEFDSGSVDQHAALISHLAKQLPLVLVTFSGGKSLHAWFYCQGENEQRLHRFMCYAVSLGADDATWGRSQFVRMPDGQRNTGKCNPDALPPEFPNRQPGRQAVIYFNPEAIR